MSLDTFCDVMALLRKAPRTARELVEVSSLNRQTVDVYLAKLRAEGHIRVCELRQPEGGGRPIRTYAWQSTLFAEPDVDVPTPSPIAVT